MPQYDSHYVSAKAVLYSPDLTHVLVNRYYFKDYKSYGLPGGHIDAGETPDQAVARELQEELGITAELRHGDFFVHGNGNIILCYVGLLPMETPLLPSNPDKETGEWLTKTEFSAADIDAGYKKFALDNWPN